MIDWLQENGPSVFWAVLGISATIRFLYWRVRRWKS